MQMNCFWLVKLVLQRERGKDLMPLTLVVSPLLTVHATIYVFGSFLRISATVMLSVSESAPIKKLRGPPKKVDASLLQTPSFLSAIRFWAFIYMLAISLFLFFFINPEFSSFVF